jgi:hypothetical protein
VKCTIKIIIKTQGVNQMKELTIVEHNNQRVLTTTQLAEVYKTETNNIVKNYSNNQKRFIEDRDFYLLQGDDLRAFKGNMNNIHFAPNLNKLYLWTERGTNRHCKILDTDMAWQQFDILEETYFKVKHNQIQLPQNYLGALKALVVSEEEKQLLKD